MPAQGCVVVTTHWLLYSRKQQITSILSLVNRETISHFEVIIS